MRNVGRGWDGFGCYVAFECCGSAGREISKEEGDTPLMPSSTMLRVRFAVVAVRSDVINFRLGTVIIPSWFGLEVVVCVACLLTTFFGEVGATWLVSCLTVAGWYGYCAQVVEVS